MKQTFVILFILAYLLAAPLLASTLEAEGNIQWFPLFVELTGGLAFFLFGMDLMSTGMKKSAGQRIKSILSSLTSNRFIGLAVGTLLTMIIQSSSATTVMLVSFVQAGLMSFSQTLSVILGASIGTTITAQLVAFKLTDIALVMVGIGFVMNTGSKNKSTKYFGEAILGFGMLFFGMKLMSVAMTPLRSYPVFIDLLKELENPYYGILFATILTAIIQSSSAFLGVIIVLAGEDMITLESGIGLVIGTNIGTCITAFLASIGARREAKRVAWAHVSFKIGGALLFVFWIPTLTSFIQKYSGFLSNDTARQIANIHTFYNVSLALFFLPFTHLTTKLITRLIPDKAEERKIVFVLRHLDDTLLNSPGIAVEMARKEISRMASTLRYMLNATIGLYKSKKIESDRLYPHLNIIDGINICKEKINFLEKRIGHYLLRIVQEELSDEQAHEVYGLLSIAKDIESISNIIQKQLIPISEKKRHLEVSFSQEGQEEINTYHLKLCKQVSRVRETLAEGNFKKAKTLMKKFKSYHDLELQYRVRHLERIRQINQHSVETHEVHTELMDAFKQINVYCGNIAKAISDIYKSDSMIDGTCETAKAQ